ncbi:hypothetical protein O3P69_014121, partial [Scylla paramamosain]
MLCVIRVEMLGGLPLSEQWQGQRVLSPAAVFDDDPGIMSEAETSSTGFCREGGGETASLSPSPAPSSKTLDARSFESDANSSSWDDDPGIMSKAETFSTGRSRNVKPRTSLPIVHTPSKTLERPL